MTESESTIAESRESQGLPPKIEDRETIQRIARLLAQPIATRQAVEPESAAA